MGKTHGFPVFYCPSILWLTLWLQLWEIQILSGYLSMSIFNFQIIILIIKIALLAFQLYSYRFKKKQFVTHLIICIQFKQTRTEGLQLTNPFFITFVLQMRDFLVNLKYFELVAMDCDIDYLPGCTHCPVTQISVFIKNRWTLYV